MCGGGGGGSGVCVQDGEGNRVFTSRALVAVASVDGS